MAHTAPCLLAERRTMQIERIYVQKCANGGNCLALHTSSIGPCGHVLNGRFHLMMPLFPLWFLKWMAKVNARHDGVIYLSEVNWHDQA